VAAEVFLDRAYAADGSLLPRSQPGAMIDDPHEAAARAVRMVCEGVVEAIDGTLLPIAADTLCIHGDGPQAVAILTAARAAIQDAGVGITAG
jgi:5-oxoprolinase (ATP-hydrolysing) subunit A